MVSQDTPYCKIWYILCLIKGSACSNLWRDIMSGFSILYRSLHCEQKESKKAEKTESFSHAKSETQSGSAVNPLRALIAKIF